MKNQLTLRKRTVMWIGRVLAAATTGSLAMVSASASVTTAPKTNNPDANLSQVTQPIIGLVNQVATVLIVVVTAVGALFCISLGVKFAKAEEPQEREKAKQHLKNAIIGFVLIFVLVVALRLAAPQLTAWMNKAAPSA